VGTSSGSPPPTLSDLSPPLSGATMPSDANTPIVGRQSPPSSPPIGRVAPKRNSSPPHMNSSDIARANQAPREFQPKTPPRPGVDVTDDVSSPGSWSTAATPGTDDRTTKDTDGFEYEGQDTPTRAGKGKGSSRLKNAWVSGELENRSDGSDEGGLVGTVPQRRTVRFTPSVTGGISQPVSPDPTYAFNPQLEPHMSPSSKPPPSTDGHNRKPSTSSRTDSPPKRNRAGSLSSPPRSAEVPSAPPVPSLSNYQPSAPPLPYEAPVPVYASPLVPPSPPSPPPDLTPQLIAKAQKHCRFAISALDYEDAAQARKELRAALAVLGS
jgi:vacuolar protein sorting-associated protein VTA1